MLFQDIAKTFIFIDDKNKLIKFSKTLNTKQLEVVTTEIKCILNYTVDEERDNDYNKLKQLVE